MSGVTATWPISPLPPIGHKFATLRSLDVRLSMPVEVNKHLTSKTCGKCGKIKEDLGSNHVYECKKCGNVIGRDVNDARNILIRNREKIII